MVPTAADDNFAERRVGLDLKFLLHRRIILRRQQNRDGFIHRSGQVINCCKEQPSIEMIAGFQNRRFQLAVLDIQILITPQQTGNLVGAQAPVSPTPLTLPNPYPTRDSQPRRLQRAATALAETLAAIYVSPPQPQNQ